MSMHGRAHGPMALAVVLVLTGSGLADASPVCDRLRSEWIASASGEAPGARREALQQAYDRQRDEIDALEERMRQIGCSVGSVVVFGGPYDEDCHRMNALLSDMDRNLAVLGNSLEDEGSHDVLAEALRSNGCAGAPPPITGVSQFNDPSKAQIEDLTPGSRQLLPVPDWGQSPSITHLELAPPAIDDRPKEFLLPPNLGPLPQAKARPMTEYEKNVRTVGPTFLPDPSEDLDLRASPPGR